MNDFWMYPVLGIIAGLLSGVLGIGGGMRGRDFRLSWCGLE